MLAEVAARARDRLGVEVDIHRVDPESWREPEGNAFLETVAERPRVVLVAESRGG